MRDMQASIESAVEAIRELRIRSGRITNQELSAARDEGRRPQRHVSEAGKAESPSRRRFDRALEPVGGLILGHGAQNR